MKLYFCLALYSFVMASGAADLSVLKKLEILVPTPTYLPTGLQLTSAKTKQTDDEGTKYTDYTLEYCNTKKQCFSIESAYGEVGEPTGGTKAATGKSKLFGSFSVEGDDEDGSVTSSWMRDQEMIKAEAANKWPSDKGRFHRLAGHGLTLKDAVKVVESLQPLKK